MTEKVGSSPVEIQFPTKFQGMFARQRARYLPLVREARETLRSLQVPEVVRPQYEHGVLEHAQPSFMLLPMMYLAMADHLGGVTERHRRYLPWYMLAMELVAVLDDSVDRTPYRSGRLTYHQRFGDPSATAFSAFLLSVVVSRTAETAPEVLPMVTGLFEKLCALQTWEYHSRYPSVTPESCARWLQSHYDAVTPAVSHSLDAALALHGRGPVPIEVCERFGEVMQDVDDLVNFVERREADGENDDLKLGIVTFPLLSTIRAEPRVAASVERMWSVYRPRCSSPTGDLGPLLAECAAETSSAYDVVARAIARHGVDATVAKVTADADACVEATPPELRTCVRDMVQAFAARVTPFERDAERRIASG